MVMINIAEAIKPHNCPDTMWAKCWKCKIWTGKKQALPDTRWNSKLQPDKRSSCRKSICRRRTSFMTVQNASENHQNLCTNRPWRISMMRDLQLRKMLYQRAGNIIAVTTIAAIPDFMMIPTTTSKDCRWDVIGPTIFGTWENTLCSFVTVATNWALTCER